ncbi:MAG: hypothetical protein WKF96_22950 [Solirubrobacteraceae bacterium]
MDAEQGGLPVEVELESHVPPEMRRRGLITKSGGRTTILDPTGKSGSRLPWPAA